MIMGIRAELAAGDGFDLTQQGTVKTARIARPPPPPHKQKRQEQAAAAAAQQQQQQGAPQLRCPRCDSTNTKFCYYNNYSRAQPRHFCKACRRHWTKGGTLRNVPVGGGRKPKRSKSSGRPFSADPAKADVDDADTVVLGVSSAGQLLPALSFPPDHLLSPALLPSSTLPPPSAYAHTAGYLGALLSLHPTVPRAAVAGVVDGSGASAAAFSPFLSLAGEDRDWPAGISSDMGTAFGSTAMPPPPWDPLLLPPPGPPTCSGGSVTTASSGLTALDSSSSPSSGCWGSCWDDLSGFLSVDLEQHPPPAADAGPPQDLCNVELS